MATLDVTTLTGSVVTLDAEALAALQANMRGQLLCSRDAGYEAARIIWNAHIDKRPALIARCVGLADVIEAVRFARTHQLLTAVHGGGHNFPGMSLCQGRLVIDLSLMTGGRRVVGIGVCYNGSRAASDSVLQPLQALGQLLLNTVQPLSYTQVQHLLDGVTPAGNRYYGKSHLMADIADDAMGRGAVMMRCIEPLSSTLISRFFSPT